MNRRIFLGTALAAGAAAYGRISGSNSRTRIAVIGLNGRGGDHLSGFKGLVTAICDCDRRVLERRAAELGDANIRQFVDFRELLDSDVCDCVSIATPNHTHSLIAIAALQAGKDVYVEKPVSHNVWEGRRLSEVARETGRVCQCGTQARSSPCLKEAAAYVRAGNLGKLLYAIGTCYKPRMSIGKLNEPLRIPDSVDYELWCGPAEKRPLFRPKLHYDWHWDYNTGNGDMGNQGIHQMDIARWFLGESRIAPRTISIGGRLGYDDAGNTANTQIVLHDYPNAPLIFETRGLPRDFSARQSSNTWSDNMDEYRGSRVGVVVQCEQGYVLIANYSVVAAYDLDGTKIKEWTGDADHYQNFLEAVNEQSSELLNAPVEEGHLSSALCHTGGISHQVGGLATVEEIRGAIQSHSLFLESFERMLDHLAGNQIDVTSKPTLTMGASLEIDPSTERILNNEAASQLLAREYRKPFEIAVN